MASFGKFHIKDDTLIILAVLLIGGAVTLADSCEHIERTELGRGSGALSYSLPPRQDRAPANVSLAEAWKADTQAEGQPKARDCRYADMGNAKAVHIPSRPTPKAGCAGSIPASPSSRGSVRPASFFAVSSGGSKTSSWPKAHGQRHEAGYLRKVAQPEEGPLGDALDSLQLRRCVFLFRVGLESVTQSLWRLVVHRQHGGVTDALLHNQPPIHFGELITLETLGNVTSGVGQETKSTLQFTLEWRAETGREMVSLSGGGLLSTPTSLSLEQTGMRKSVS